jgi:hypothetical protein
MKIIEVQTNEPDVDERKTFKLANPEVDRIEEEHFTFKMAGALRQPVIKVYLKESGQIVVIPWHSVRLLVTSLP